MTGDSNREDWPSWKSIEVYRDQLLERSRKASGAESIRRVFETCQTLAAGRNLITIAAVGKFCVTNWGGPKGQSISNNRELACLVQMAAQAQQTHTKGQSHRQPYSHDEQLLSRIEDPHTRSQVQVLLVERRSLVRETNTLKAGFKRIKALEILTPEMASADVETLEQLAELLQGRQPGSGIAPFTDEEREAVRDFIDQGRWERMHGWIVDDASGEIQSRSGRPIARRGFLSALRKIAQNGEPNVKALSGNPRAVGK